MIMSNRTSTAKEMISDAAYIEILKNCSKWNSRVMGGRKRSETAVYDQQTGIVHRPTEHLFRHPSERQRAQNPMQVYVYPPRHWVKPKNNAPSAAIEVNYFLRVNPALKEAVNAKTEQTQPQSTGENNVPTSEQQQLPLPPNSNNNSIRAATTGNSAKIYQENEFDLEYDLDEPDYNDPQSDEDDWGASRKKKKRPLGAGGTSTGGGRSAGRKAAANSGGMGQTMNTGTTPIVVKIPKSEGADSAGTPSSSMGTPGASGGGTTAATSTVEPRPFICQLCGAKYKSRPGLTYHKIHVHQSESNSNETPKSPLISSKVQISDYCDFCLGDTSKNADGKPEELITCHDCGRSGHPSCLKFTKNMLISTKRFGWQCIECKSCAICGTSENDDQLLFCDDCDRGFHLYCLRPPLKAPPETDWSCHLCVKAFGPDASMNKTKNDEQSSSSGK